MNKQTFLMKKTNIHGVYAYMFLLGAVFNFQEMLKVSLRTQLCLSRKCRLSTITLSYPEDGKVAQDVKNFGGSRRG